MHLIEGSCYRVSLERTSHHFERGTGSLYLITAFELSKIHNYILSVGNILILTAASPGEGKTTLDMEHTNIEVIHSPPH